jgi:thiol-disulfide isomerase/thioredoxin
MKNLLLTIACILTAFNATSINLADTCKIHFYIDDNRASIFSLQALQDSAKIDYLGGNSHPRAAISVYGEKYRTGVIFYKSTGSAPLYWLNGTISPFHNGEQIMLFHMLGDSILSADSTRIEQGRFIFRGRQNLLTDMAVLTLGNYPDPVTSLDVILDAGTIKVNMDSLTACGTPLNDQYRAFLAKKDSSSANITKLWKKDNRQAYVVGSDLYRAKIDYYNLHLNTIKSNISNPLGYRVFQSYYPEINDRELATLDSLFPKAFKPVTLFADEWTYRKKRSESTKGLRSLIGVQYKDFELLNITGGKQKLSDLLTKNNYIYLDFWASWCGPCRAEIPGLKKLYETYHSKGVEFVGISMDTSMPVWRRSLTEVDAPWLHLSDLKGMHSELTDAYHVLGIPEGFLIDKTGKIVMVCTVDGLAVQLKKLFPTL